jgi:hypothetical protein
MIANRLKTHNLHYPYHPSFLEVSGLIAIYFYFKISTIVGFIILKSIITMPPMVSLPGKKTLLLTPEDTLLSLISSQLSVSIHRHISTYIFGLR